MSLEHDPARAGSAAVGHREAEAPAAEEPDASEPDRFIGEPECKRLTSLSRVSRWRLERDGLFPRRRRLSPNRVGWLLSEIREWQLGRAVA